MKFVFKLALVAVVILAVSLLAVAQQKAEVKKGETLYAKHCTNCHGPKGEGKPAIAKAMGVTMKPLSSPDIQGMTDADLQKAILEGKGKMKPVKVTNTEAADIVAYIRTLK